MLLSEILRPGEALEPAAMSARLIPLARYLYANGWTVIGSRFKTPDLFAWKAPDRAALLEKSIEALSTGRANSLNLRLSDSNVIALDCDFHAPDLMEKFISQLGHYLSLPKSRLCTCTGAKGCKVFLRYIPEYHTARMPRVLGLKFSDLSAPPAAAGNMLEIKRDVSTVAGLYGPSGNDWMIYGPYRDYPYVLHTRPDAIPVISRADLTGIEEIYLRLVSSMNRFARDGSDKPWQAPAMEDMTFSAVCAFAVDLDARIPGTRGWNFRLPDFAQWHDMARVYHCLGLHDALMVIRVLFYGHKCPAAAAALCSDIRDRIVAMTLPQLAHKAARAEALLTSFHARLRARAGMRGMASRLLPGLNTGALERVMYQFQE